MTSRPPQRHDGERSSAIRSLAHADADVPEQALNAFRLDGRIAFVTGAASGVGRASAELIAQAGAIVVCADHASTETTVQTITRRGGEASSRSLDVSSQLDVDTAINEVIRNHGQLDILINSAGVHTRGPGAQTTESDIDRLFDVNFKGTFFTCRAAVGYMSEGGGGSIVNISSMIIDVASPELLAYGVSKAGVRQLTRTFAAEFGPKNVRVNDVAPGWMLTKMTRGIARTQQGDESAVLERQRTRESLYPLGRTGTPLDVAYAALFLASDASSWLTGQSLKLNGGGSIPW